MIPTAEKFKWCIALTAILSYQCSAAVSVEVFVRTRSGQTVRLSSSPVKAVEAKMLVETVSLLDALAPEQSYDRFFLALSSVKGLEGIFTDATGTAPLIGLNAEHFVVVRDRRLVLTAFEEYLWIIPAAEARDGKLLLGNHNLGLDHFRDALKSKPVLQKSVVAKLRANVDRAMGQKDFARARTLASNMLYFGDVEGAATIVSDIDRKEATGVLPGWYCAMIKQTLDQAWTQPSHLQSQLSCVVYVRIKRDGTVSKAWFNRKSGEAAMDESVLSAVKSVQRVAPLPSSFGKDFADIPVEFELKSGGAPSTRTITSGSNGQKDTRKQSRGPVALNVIGMPHGAYSKKMFTEIGRRWTLLIDQYYADGQPGKVKINFTLYPTGRVDHLKVAQNTGPSILGSYCVKAVVDSAPFDPWPEELKLLGGDHLDISIEFSVYLYDR